jgi:hypothetical protein
MTTSFAKASRELEWRFGAAASSLDVHAQSYDPDTLGGVWDEARLERLHTRMRGASRDVRRLAKIDAALGFCDARTLALAFTPRRWAWSTPLHEEQVRAAFLRQSSQLTLTALVLTGKCLADEYLWRFHHPPESVFALQRFLERECEASVTRTPNVLLLTRLRRDAEARLKRAVQGFISAFDSVETESKRRMIAVEQGL